MADKSGQKKMAGKYILFTWKMCGHCQQLKQMLPRTLQLQEVELTNATPELYNLFTQISPQKMVPVLYDANNHKAIFGNENIASTLMS